MKPRHTAEQSTVKVNKAETINAVAPAAATETVAAAAPRRGFGFGAVNN
jgi:ribonucleoside-diphosphate reductase alpha chain